MPPRRSLRSSQATRPPNSEPSPEPEPEVQPRGTQRRTRTSTGEGTQRPRTRTRTGSGEGATQQRGEGNTAHDVPGGTQRVRTHSGEEGTRRSQARKARPPAPEADSDENDHLEGEGAGEGAAPSAFFSLQTFRNQPVDSGSDRMLRAFLTNWSMPAGHAEERGVGLLADTARAVGEAGGDEELDRELESAIRKMIDVQQRIRAHTATLDGLRQRIAQGEKLADLTELYTQGAQEKWEVWEGKTARQRYGKDEGYFQFRDGVWQGQNGDDNAMAPDFITKELEREDGDLADEDEDIFVGGNTQQLKCPLTLRYLTSCLTSTKCKHSYSREAILQYLPPQGGKQCPATGCDVLVSRAELVEDKDKERRARRAEEKEREGHLGLDEEPVEEMDDSVVL
ncbi:hypothetical protein DACRYDRAFT_106452 [Dacryopinax primogenitus]|uniref:SP-RING-type domain-containing protein n=1 Tax=Dacryopinax primogenitus (strain DJM 731) TaxID=1858805 RepID=M5G3N8_DACPD|nr:uncharacterized protein DACRYDRAFT_106452 [Dacryopinax primogenitus]EJU03289.1 hypothetical protein DACRYDRAFT_106452 [Dacryopinax primogenitus]